MYVLKIDLPTGIAYFTGKKKVVQGCESPGLTGNIEGARFFMEEEEAAKFCRMLVKKYDMEFYYSIEEKKESEPVHEKNDEESFMSELNKELAAGVLDAEEDEDK
ncbi:MAG: hypothetical protein K6E47_12645 [Lachnospiraceae bacterium]|nr:hypothetical protein [Lachnospiraceae bacterium]